METFFCVSIRTVLGVCYQLNSETCCILFLLSVDSETCCILLRAANLKPCVTFLYFYTPACNGFWRLIFAMSAGQNAWQMKLKKQYNVGVTLPTSGCHV